MDACLAPTAFLSLCFATKDDDDRSLNRTLSTLLNDLMENTQRPSPLPKTAALVILTFGIAWLLHRYDALALSRIGSMSPANYIEQQRHLHQHGYLFHFIAWLVIGGFYLGAIEFVSCGIRALGSKKRSA